MSGSPGVRRVSVRYDPTMGDEGTFSMRCDDCIVRGESTAYWPLTLEFWAPSQGLQRCRACHNARKRIRHRQTVEERRLYHRKMYRADRARRLQYAHDYLIAHRDKINAARRARRAEQKDAINARRRERHAAKRQTA